MKFDSAGSRVVATLTGHGLKDPDNAISVAGLEPTSSRLRPMP
ncbi:MAG: hypothetical protein Ct9H300mP32_0140 [Verrucomicrobiota bacterium]|nr:MAG: hypothetical protein Ct9H300mP32_0140 [Verrucomicrobiota bacterium]